MTGIPLEFQFGTNWAGFSRYAGGLIGQTLAMEGMFAFFLESALVGALVYGESWLSRRAHFGVSIGVAVGSWLSAYFILVTNAFMQYPLGYDVAPDGTLRLAAMGTYLMNPGLIASVLVAFPTGDQQAKMVARHQEDAFAAMEGRFQSGRAR